MSLDGSAHVHKCVHTCIKVQSCMYIDYEWTFYSDLPGPASNFLSF